MDPFLQGDVQGVDAQRSAWLRGLEHLEQVLARWTDGLDADGYWWTPADELNPIASLVRHIGGSSLRLLRYAQGTMPTDALRQEGAHDFDRTGTDGAAVYALCRDRLREVRQGLLALGPADYVLVREVGRKRVPVRTTIIVQHLLEHAHAHAGQVVVMRKLYDVLEGEAGVSRPAQRG